MKKLPIIILLFGLLISSFLLTIPVLADVAPPYKPQGSNISSSNDTMVQMVTENVLLEIVKNADDVYYQRATAEFLMRNQGSSDEEMNARFPLENLNGMGDGWGENSKIRNFAVKVDGVWLSTEEVKQPFYEGAPAVAWEEFSVKFPAGVDVLIQIYYDVDLNEANYPNWMNADYILQTGTGWYGSIQNGVVVLRYPFAVSELNSSGWMQQQDCVAVGRERRCHFANLEPEDNVRFSIVEPSYWQRILDLELTTGEKPEDPDLAIELAELYSGLSVEKHGVPVYQEPVIAAEMIIEQALLRNPENLKLHMKMAELLGMEQETILNTLYSDSITNEEIQEIQNWISKKNEQFCSEVDIILQLDPDNGYGSLSFAHCEETSGENEDGVTETPSETPIQTPKSMDSPNNAPLASTITSTATVKTSADIAGGGNSQTDDLARVGIEGWQVGLLAAGSGLTGFLTGILIYRKKESRRA